ncbi:TetR/AcrR family transcriptional regulator [Amycolatopsis anabasis]|uniref:TetR/AcrR family transcriptional regulator n=1 Tax=Amycolatopsis anabasis TaxID=1840409 RepID=UPI001FE4A24F|nr:TetR/AcrR family transcriptional regulator [Amycolatopsis anabasis]
MPEARRRLTPEQRRSQLLDVGAAMFAEHAYEDVLMEDIAARAGVSRALVYRYFPGKRDLFAAIFQRDSERLLAASEIDPALPMADQVRAGLDAHLDYFATHKQNILTANYGALAGDPAVQAIISDELAALRNRMLEALGSRGHAREVASVALHGWLAFVRTVCVEWLLGSELSRDEVRDLCFRALSGLFAAQLGFDRLTGAEEQR